MFLPLSTVNTRDKALGSIAISLKRRELSKNRSGQTMMVLRGFRDWQNTLWIAIQNEEDKIMKELKELESLFPSLQ
jgi:hypothetical protein